MGSNGYITLVVSGERESTNSVVRVEYDLASCDNSQLQRGSSGYITLVVSGERESTNRVVRVECRV